jgi:hypothetical protein
MNMARTSKMKSPVAVTLIVMGSLLILAPIGADYFYQRNLISLLAKGQAVLATVIDHLGVWYRLVCWLTGSVMILVGMVAAAADCRASHYEIADEEAESDADEKEEQQATDAER